MNLGYFLWTVAINTMVIFLLLFIDLFGYNDLSPSVNAILTYRFYQDTDTAVCNFEGCESKPAHVFPVGTTTKAS